MQNKIEKEKILIVCNDPQVSRQIDVLLMQKKYKVVKAWNTEEVFNKLKENIPDLIILDIDVFGLEDEDLEAEINEYISNSTIPVILVLDNEIGSNKLKGYSFSAIDYVTKPVDAEELYAMLDAVLNRKRFYEGNAMTDNLTGLYNTHFFNIQLNLFFNMAKRYKKSFSLMIIDIQNLKFINDNYGYSVGNLVVDKISSVLKEAFRKTDIIIRYKSDEFAVMLPETTSAQAEVVYKKIRDKIKDRMFIYRGAGEKMAFDINIGIATYNEQMTNEIQLFEQAYANLISTKREHGN